MPTVATFDIEYLQYLGPDGKLVREDLPEFAQDRRKLVELFKQMLIVRMLRHQGGRPAAHRQARHLCLLPGPRGHPRRHRQRRCSTTTCSRRAIASTARSSCAACKPREVLMYWGGDERGNDFSGPPHDYSWCVPIGTQCLHAAGAALAFKLRERAAGGGGLRRRRRLVQDRHLRRDQFGRRLSPCRFVLCIINNGWAISVPRKAQTGAKTLAQKGIAGGLRMPAGGRQRHHRRARRRCDFALKRARNGEGGSVHRIHDLPPVRPHHRRRRAPLPRRGRGEGRLGRASRSCACATS